MQVTKGTWRMREQCVPGSLSSSPAQEPGKEARCGQVILKVPQIEILGGCGQTTSDIEMTLRFVISWEVRFIRS